MRRTIVINVVGLSPRMLGPETPNLSKLAAEGAHRPLTSIMPAVTCSAQATFLTGALPTEHGIVGNGWYFRDLSEIWFWRQSAALVGGDKLWDVARARDPGFTCANMFWWYNMYSGADIGVTPRPIYLADGRKLPDCYSAPAELRDELTGRLGTFPLFSFWGPATTIASSEWIARASIHVRQTRDPTLTLIYLPHLDYGLQRVGPHHPSIADDLRQVDAVCGEIIADAARDGAQVVVLSEYGITPVNRPVHINRALRRAGLLAVRDELGHEQLDAGASHAFAVSDHQVAHVYVRDPARVGEVKALLAALPGVERVLDADGKGDFGLDHPRSGELVAIAAADSWFTYYHWLDDARAPDFARTVEIHRKPGYDPVELFFDPKLGNPKLAAGWRLAKRKLGFRALMDVIPLTAELVKGSHGRMVDDAADGPIFISSNPDLVPDGQVAATQVRDLILAHVFDGAA
ncbi:alkaline phosphatase family protein [Sphingomonas quercus]|uniref:Alkaline phosphatase family protein n=1 Tax=Sphingomonas quercus TaxID=2842451 RepID=A0ABS6BNL5_9SPHN|nr:nucleotide pyrophosphatase/phosphodiesterase family protein [Sphingomonas quercus]MBU3078981.1 alkaline phosphatase family protein [Sphingomonas quercus]